MYRKSFTPLLVLGGLLLILVFGAALLKTGPTPDQKPVVQFQPAQASGAAAASIGPNDNSAPGQSSDANGVSVVAASRFAITPPLRDMPAVPAGMTKAADNDRPPSFASIKRNTKDLRVQDWFSLGLPAIPSPIASWDGVANSDNASAVYPPDINGDVGPNNYVQWVNLEIEIWDKSGTRLLGPIPGNQLFAPLGAPCGTRNDGDPIVLYDALADRWLLTQFALPGGGLPVGTPHQCIAVSRTGDPTGSYAIYDFTINPLANIHINDYPKFGIWPDAYYASFNMFGGGTNAYQGVVAYAFNRAQMVAGQTASAIGIVPANRTTFFSMIPADLDGPTLPPNGASNVFVSEDQALFDLDTWKFHVDWTTPANSTFTGPTRLATATFNDLCPTGNRSCVPQPGTAVGLDGLGGHTMYRLAYRNFGDHESWVTNNAVDVGSGSVQAAVHWYELRSTPRAAR